MSEGNTRLPMNPLHRIYATAAVILAAAVSLQVSAQAPESLRNHIIILHGGQAAHTLQLQEGKEQPVVREIESPYASTGATLVFDAEELKLHGYQRENFGCAGIAYQRLDEHNALLQYQDADYNDMWIQQTLLVFEGPANGHYYEIEYTIGTNGSRITTIHNMGTFCIHPRVDEAAGAYMGETNCDCSAPRKQ